MPARACTKKAGSYCELFASDSDGSDFSEDGNNATDEEEDTHKVAPPRENSYHVSRF